MKYVANSQTVNSYQGYSGVIMKAEQQLMRHQVPLFIQQKMQSAHERGIISYQRTAFLPAETVVVGGFSHWLQGRGGKNILELEGMPIKSSDITRRA